MEASTFVLSPRKKKSSSVTRESSVRCRCRLSSAHSILFHGPGKQERKKGAAPFYHEKINGKWAFVVM